MNGTFRFSSLGQQLQQAAPEDFLDFPVEIFWSLQVY